MASLGKVLFQARGELLHQFSLGQVLGHFPLVLFLLLLSSLVQVHNLESLLFAASKVHWATETVERSAGGGDQVLSPEHAALVLVDLRLLTAQAHRIANLPQQLLVRRLLFFGVEILGFIYEDLGPVEAADHELKLSLQSCHLKDPIGGNSVSIERAAVGRETNSRAENGLFVELHDSLSFHLGHWRLDQRLLARVLLQRILFLVQILV